ncbi:MAG: hypothetical protein MZU84_02805 [Sphingobacterium sp.]|nr:hypothetical protein [Sphingobacterium sp.]
MSKQEKGLIQIMYDVVVFPTEWFSNADCRQNNNINGKKMDKSLESYCQQEHYHRPYKQENRYIGSFPNRGIPKDKKSSGHEYECDIEIFPCG